MAVDIPGLVTVIVFYIIILIVGVIAARKRTRHNTSEETFLANRSMGAWLAFLSLSATLIGGGVINGTAESIAFSGLLWTNAPFLYNISLLVACFVFAPKLRQGNYVTMFDPIQAKLGQRIGGLLVIPDLFSDCLWAASILSALGSTLALILDVDFTVAIIVSCCVAVLYTFLGGLYSVAYTDIIQLAILTVGLIVSFPFSLYHPSVDLSSVNGTWIGEIEVNSIGIYIDLCLQFSIGSVAWQVYYQRALACKTLRVTYTSTVLAIIASTLILISPVAIGIVGRATDWNATDYEGPIPIPEEEHSAILPMVLKYLCPRPVAVVGIAAVSAAVMSSADSCILAAGVVMSKNVYKDIIRPKASDRELIWMMRIGVLVTGIIACLIAILVKSVYGLFYLASDLTYVLLSPQLTCVLWVKFTNGYGSITAYIICLFLRIAAGDPLLRIPPLIKYPFYSEAFGQRFPFRTLCALVNFAVLISVSWATHTVFKKRWLPRKFDFLQAVNFNEDKPAEKITKCVSTASVETEESTVEYSTHM